MSALASAALLAFVLSLGPSIWVGGAYPVGNNAIFTSIYGVLPLLHSTRVVARFGILPLFFLVIAASMGLDALIRLKRLRRRAWGVVLVLVALVLLEGRTTPFRFEDEAARPPPLDSLPVGEASPTLLVLPMGERFNDSRYMLALARSERLLVNGWSGFRPRFQERIARHFSSGRAEEGIRELRRLWPDPWIVVDRIRMRMIRELHPYHLDEADLRRFCDVRIENARYLVCVPKPERSPVRAYSRLVRLDLGRKFSVIRFKARSLLTDGPRRLRVECNGERVVARLSVSEDWWTFAVPIPKTCFSHAARNEVTIRSEDDSLWEIRGFRFAAGDASDPLARHRGGVGFPHQSR